MINNLREDKDREIRSLRSQLCQFQQDISRREGNNSDLQIKLHELTSMLEEKDACIKQQQEDLFRLKHERLSNSQSPGVTTVITKKYRNQYPILGLLSDDYKVTSPVNKSQTIVIERSGEIWKHEWKKYLGYHSCSKEFTITNWSCFTSCYFCISKRVGLIVRERPENKWRTWKHEDDGRQCLVCTVVNLCP